MPDGLFTVAVVTPERRLLEGPATSVVVRTSDGNLTVLDGHTPLVADVVPGEVRVDQEEGEPVRLAVHGGFLQVDNGTSATAPVAAAAAGAPSSDGKRTTTVTLLAGIAERIEDIDVPRAQRAREAATARIEELQAATGRQQGQGAPAGDGAEGAASPQEVELAEVEAALVRAEVRLTVAGADQS